MGLLHIERATAATGCYLLSGLFVCVCVCVCVCV